MYQKIGILPKVFTPSIINGVKLDCRDLEQQNLKTVNLLSKKPEAIQSDGCNMHNHYQPSITMEICRPTLTKIDGSTLQKENKAFRNKLQITIRSGKVDFDSNWHYYNICKCDLNTDYKGKNYKRWKSIKGAKEM